MYGHHPPSPHPYRFLGDGWLNWHKLEIILGIISEYSCIICHWGNSSIRETTSFFFSFLGLPFWLLSILTIYFPTSLCYCILTVWNSWMLLLVTSQHHKSHQCFINKALYLKKRSPYWNDTAQTYYTQKSTIQHHTKISSFKIYQKPKTLFAKNLSVILNRNWAK